MKGKLIAISVFTVIASIVFYCSILFQPMYFFEFEALPILLFLAEGMEEGTQTSVLQSQMLSEQEQLLGNSVLQNANSITEVNSITQNILQNGLEIANTIDSQMEIPSNNANIVILQGLDKNLNTENKLQEIQVQKRNLHRVNVSVRF